MNINQEPASRTNFILQRKVIYILLLFSLVPVLYAQQSSSDTTGQVPGKADTVSAAPDEVQTTTSDIDTAIFYEAKVIRNDLDERKSYFIGNASVTYKNIKLQAGKITLDWDEHLIVAESIKDTIWVKKDSLSTDSTRQIKTTGQPKLTEGGQTMVGDKMFYNYKTEKGRIVRGRTEVEGGYYQGNQIKRVHKKDYHITYSNYTTCDLDSNPHYHFEARRMKMIPNDKVIAKPVVMYLGNMPVAALPFVVFPNKKGRHSGITIPRYGQSAREGRFLRNVGYYWAPNDYFGAKMTVDFFERTGWMFRANTDYAIRYLLNGSLSGSLTKKEFASGGEQRRWDLRLRHSQEISPTSRFTASGYFVSDNSFYKNYSTNLDMRLTRELRSNATYNKSWPKHKLSLSANVSQTHDLQTDTKTLQFPQLSFRMGQRQIFKRDRKRGTRRIRAPWYESIYFSYNSSLINSEREYLTYSGGDTLVKADRNRKISHDTRLSLNSPTKYFGWLSLNQSMSFQEDWFDETFDYYYDDASQSVEKQKVSGFAARHIFSYNASANTKVYGMFPGFGDVQAFRHVITPSLSFRYQPDFSKEMWGYYQRVQQPGGDIVKRDRFGGGTPSYGSSSINWRVGNLFQMKRGEGKQAKKIDLFNLDLSGGYNFRADKNKMSDMRSSLRANPLRNISLSASTTHSFYKYDSKDSFGGVSDTYLFEDGGWKSGNILRLMNFRFNLSFRLQGKSEQPSRPRDYEMQGMQGYAGGQGMDTSVLEEQAREPQDRFEPEDMSESLSIPWRMNIRFNFDLNKRNPSNPQKRYYMDISGAEVNLTKNWRIGYNAHYDLEEMKISHHRFTIYRDLHCWEAHINWVPSGPGRRVYVRVNIKAPILQDIKIEKHAGRGSVLGY